MKQSRTIFVLVASLVAMAGLVLVLISALIDTTATNADGLAVGTQHVWLQHILAASGSLAVGTVSLSVIWEFIGRRMFLDDVLTRVNLAEQVRSSGLKRLERYSAADPAWDQLIRTCNRVDLLFVYNGTWRNTHRAALDELASRDGVRMRVLLADPDDHQTMADLGRRYQLEPDTLAGRVREAATAFSSLGTGEAHADIDVRVAVGAHVYAYYRFDDTAIATLYTHTPGRRSVPLIEFSKGGTLYDDLKDDFEEAWSSGRSWKLGAPPGTSPTEAKEEQPETIRVEPERRNPSI